MHMGISECVPSFKTFYHTVVLIHNKNSMNSHHASHSLEAPVTALSPDGDSLKKATPEYQAWLLISLLCDYPLFCLRSRAITTAAPESINAAIGNRNKA